MATCSTTSSRRAPTPSIPIVRLPSSMPQTTLCNSSGCLSLTGRKDGLWPQARASWFCTRSSASVVGEGGDRAIPRWGAGRDCSRQDRVADGSHPPPAPTERRVRIAPTTLFRRCFTAQRRALSAYTAERASDAGGDPCASWRRTPPTADHVADRDSRASCVATAMAVRPLILPPPPAPAPGGHRATPRRR
jgi:hypothetical protein